uniref:THO complex subunit 1 isoform X1 n=1 Tax=Tanacetum cinerariifolium TaxID=118510 RepID=A0A6L2MXL7_TANCI|nr:THO complex subunit 1 isoform X1 [Tanacetum cinerariifolium]
MWLLNCKAESASINSTEAYVICDTTNFRKRMEDVLYCSFSIQIAHAIFSPDDLSLLDSSVPSFVETGGTKAKTEAKSSNAEGDEDMEDADETVKSEAGGKKDLALKIREFLVDSGVALQHYCLFKDNVSCVPREVTTDEDYFSNPASVGPTTTKWRKFPSCLMVFFLWPLNNEDGAANSIEDEAATFNLKYLTSSSRIFEFSSQ